MIADGISSLQLLSYCCKISCRLWISPPITSRMSGRSLNRESSEVRLRNAAPIPVAHNSKSARRLMSHSSSLEFDFPRQAWKLWQQRDVRWASIVEPNAACSFAQQAQSGFGLYIVDWRNSLLIFTDHFCLVQKIPAIWRVLLTPAGFSDVLVQKISIYSRNKVSDTSDDTSDDFAVGRSHEDTE